MKLWKIAAALCVPGVLCAQVQLGRNVQIGGGGSGTAFETATNFTGQYAIVYPTFGAIDNDPHGDSTIGPQGGHFNWACSGLLCTLAPTLHAHWTGFALPSYVNPANVTAVYADAVSSGTPLLGQMPFTGAAVTRLSCTGMSGGTSTLFPLYGGQPPWDGQELSSTTSLTGATVSTTTCSIVLGASGNGDSGMSVDIPAIRLIVFYTGTPPPADTAIKIAPPLCYNTATLTLGDCANNRYINSGTDPLSLSLFSASDVATALVLQNSTSTSNYQLFTGGSANTFPGSLGFYNANTGHDPLLIKSNDDVILSSLGSSTSPICPNGTGGALTTVGCAGGGGGSGTVTSVGLSLPAAVFTASGSPVTTSGTLTGTLATQSANTFFAGPTTGSVATPTFRSLVAADLPLATTGAFGAVKPDGTTVTISGGVISASGGGGGGLSGQTTGYMPLATSATTSTISSALEDTGASLVYHGTGTAHGLTLPEGTAISAAAGNDILYADATSHCLQYSANGGAFACLGSGSTAVNVNGSPVSSPNFGSSPSATTGHKLASLAVSTSNVSISVPEYGRVPVEDFGAVGDSNGTTGNGTDNTTAIQNCVNSLLSSNTVSACMLQAGKIYRITSALAFNTSSTGLIGNAPGQGPSVGGSDKPALLMIDSASANAINVGNVSTTTYNIFENFSIMRPVLPTGTATAFNFAAANGLIINHVQAADNIRCMAFLGGASYGIGTIENTQCYNGYNSAVTGYGTTATYFYYLDSDLTHQFASLKIKQATCADGSGDVNNTCFELRGSAINDVHVHDIEAATSGTGIHVNYTGSGLSGSAGAYDVHFWNPIIQATTGVVINNATAAAAGGVEIHGGWIYSTTNGTAIDIESSSGVTIDNTQVLTGTTTVNSSSSIALRNNSFGRIVSTWQPVTLTSVTASTISNNIIRASGSGTQACFFCFVSSSNNTTGNNTFNVLSGNTLNYGISFNAASNNNQACGNTISGAGTFTSLTTDAGSGNELCSGGGAFSAITGGTNTSAAMVVGTGASVTASGTGSIQATNRNPASCDKSSGGFLCLTDSTYNASPYGATTTTGTFSAGATSGTVGSCSTFAAGNGALIAGGASGGWNGTSYIGTVVSCSSTTLTITPAITNAVTGAAVKHDETAAFLAAFTALNTIGGTIYLPNISASVQGTYLVNGALSDPGGSGHANAILIYPTIANYSSTPIIIRIDGMTRHAYDGPIIKSDMTTSGANLFGGYDGATGGGFAGFTNVNAQFSSLSIILPAGTQATAVNGEWLLGLDMKQVDVVTTNTATTPGTGSAGVVFPTVSNNLYLSADDLNVEAYANCVQAGEHSNFGNIFVAKCTNGFIADAAPSGGVNATHTNGVTVAHLWCGSTTNTVLNCLVSGANATQVDIRILDWEDNNVGDKMITDSGNLLHGYVGFNRPFQSCPTAIASTGGTNLQLNDLKCANGGRTTVTTGSPTSGHLAIFNSDNAGNSSITDGGAVPAGGGETNITASITWTGCAVSGTVCTVSTPGNSVTAASIPGTYTHLKIIENARVSDSIDHVSVTLQFNGDAGTNYGTEQFFGGNATASASPAQTAGTSGTGCVAPGNTAPANLATGCTLTIYSYAGTTFAKSFWGASSSFGSTSVNTNWFNYDVKGMWTATPAAVTQVKLIDGSGGNFVAGTSFTVYGIP